MSEYRICEKCENKNDVNSLQCFSCGADLSYIMITEEESPLSQDDGETVANQGETTHSKPKLIKVCEVCSYANDIGLMECESCGNDISYIRPAPLDEAAPDPSQESSSHNSNNYMNASIEPSQTDGRRATVVMKTLVFTAVYDGFQIEIPDTGGVLGRDGIGAEYLDKSNFVSREHANLEYVDDKWVMTVLGTNPTLVNDRVVSKGMQSHLEHGDVVRLADLDFNIELK